MNHRKIDRLCRRFVNTLGHGFLKEVYENALAHELRKARLAVERSRSIKIQYDRIVVGDYLADLLVESVVLVGLKGANVLGDVHAAQCFNYLQATVLKLCVPFDFGAPKVQLRRITS
jgi:GxxExxY protein